MRRKFQSLERILGNPSTNKSYTTRLASVNIWLTTVPCFGFRFFPHHPTIQKCSCVPFTPQHTTNTLTVHVVKIQAMSPISQNSTSEVSRSLPKLWRPKRKVVGKASIQQVTLIAFLRTGYRWTNLSRIRGECSQETWILRVYTCLFVHVYDISRRCRRDRPHSTEGLVD